MTLRTPSLRRAGIGAVLAAGALALAACGGPAATGAPGGDTTAAADLPRVGSVVSYPALPSGIEQGIFDDAFGTDASALPITWIANGGEGAQALVGGHLDIAIGGFDPAVFINDELRVIAITETSPQTHALLVPPGSDATSVEDLAGKTVGGFSATLSDFLAMLLQHEGLPADTFEYIQVPNDGGMSALTSGAIDAWYTFDPFFAQAEIQGLGRPIVTGEDFYLNPIVMMTTQTYLEEHPDEVRAFLEGYIEATAWVNDNQDAAGAYMAEATGMTPEAAAATIDRRHYKVEPVSDEVRAYMDDLSALKVELGSIESVPDLDTVIDTSTLEEVQGR